MTMTNATERIRKAEVQNRVLSAYKTFKSTHQPQCTQVEYELEHAYRLAIANGNLMGGNAEMMDDIEVMVTANGNAQVFYKGVLIGYYKPDYTLEEIRSRIKDWMKEKWFVEQINA